MNAPKKPSKLQARSPRGFADRTPGEIRAVERMMATIRGVYERYGFEPVETPFVEYTDALGKFLPDQDRPNEGVFSFQDDDEQWLSLRYDLTAPLARYVAENFEALPKPYRSYRAGWVFRNEKPGPGRFRQFMQFDADTVGAASVAADAEICMMAADTMEALGFEGQYVIKVNNRKVLDGVMEAIGLAGEENAGRRLTVMRALDKHDRLGESGVRALLGPGRTDESGDYTNGAGLTEDQIYPVLRLLRLPPQKRALPETRTSSPEDAAALVTRSVPSTVVRLQSGVTRVERPSNLATVEALKRHYQDIPTYAAGTNDLSELADLFEASNYGDRVLVDPSVVRGLEYYTGPVFEAQLTFEVPGDDGRPVQFGSVGGGGRYDGLVGRFRSEPVPATGFSVGVSRLAAALKAIGKLGDEGASGPVVVTVMDKERLADYQRMTAELRDGLNRPGAPVVPVEMYLGSSGMKAQLKYADRRDAPCVIIQGSQEAAEGKVQIKDLVAGKAAAAALADNQAWRDERPGQFEVARGELVAAVRDLLARQRAQ